MSDAAPSRLWLLLALAGPGLVLLTAAAVTLAAAALGVAEPFAAPADLTLAEAAAIGDDADVLRQIRAGADPDAPAIVRRGMVSDTEFLLTPLEAATANAHAETIDLLVRSGAALDHDTARVLICLAQDKGEADIAALLTRHVPGAAPVCRDVRLPL
jgi:hypothetical protein